MNRKKLIRGVRWGLIGLFILPLLLILLTQVKPIQTLIANKALYWLSEKLNTEVKLDNISWSRLNNLKLNGFLIRDQQSDTLLAVNQLIIQFDFWKIFQNELQIEEIDLSDALIRLHRNETYTWNFSFFSEAFPSSPDSSQPAEQFVINPNHLSLKKVRFDFSDAIASSQLNVSWDEAELQVDQLDIYQQVLSLQTFVLSQPDITYINSSSVAPVPDTLPTDFSFPDIGWAISLDQMQLNNGNISYRETLKDELPPGMFNAGDLGIQQLNWDIRRLRTDSSLISATIQSLSLEEQSGFRVSQFSTSIHFSETNASLLDFQLTTPHSFVQQSIALEYPALKALELFSNPSSTYDPADIRVEASIEDASLSPADLRRWLDDILPPEFAEPLVLKGSVTGTLAELNILENLSYTSLQLQLNSEGQVTNLLDPQNLYFDLSLDTLRADYAKLSSVLPPGILPPEFNRWGLIDLRGRIQGNINDFETRNLQIQTRTGPAFKGDVRIVGLPDYKKANYRLQLDYLKTSQEDWAAFLPDTLPEVLENVDKLVLRGTFDGSIYQFDTNLNLELKEGNILTNTHFDFKEDYSDAFYNGRIQLQQFDLGSFLQDSLLSVLNLDLDIDGKGLQLADLDTEIQGVISDPSYNSYQYDSLFLHGVLDSTSFDGNISMSDPNLQFVFDGRIPFRDSMPNYRFTLQLDTINLMPLGFYAAPLGVSSQLVLDLKNYQIDDLEGSLALTDFTIQDSLTTFHADSITVNSRTDDAGLQQLTLDSEWLQLGLEGQYTLSKLPQTLLDWLDQDFPFNTILFPIDSTSNGSNPEEEIILPPTNITAYLRISEGLPIAKIFLPELKILERISLNLEFDKAAELWNFQANVPGIEYAGYQLDSMSFTSNYLEKGLTNVLTSSVFRSGENTVIYQPTAQAILKNDSLHFELLSFEKTDSVSWQIGGDLTTDTEEISFHLDPQIRLNGQTWNVEPGNQIVYSSSHQWQINQLGLLKDNGSIFLNGSGRRSDSTSLINIAFNQFEIASLTPFLDLPNGYISGSLNGDLEARDFQKLLHYTANMDLQNWRMDSVLIGDLRLQAEQLNNEPIIHLSAELQSIFNQLGVIGTYDIERQYFDVLADIGQIEMQALDPFLPGLIHDSDGYVSGRFSLIGSPELPNLTGLIQLHEIKTTLDYVNIPYRIEEAAISFTEKKIDFGEIRMMDSYNQQAVLSGEINHRNFNDMFLALRFQTDRFQFLNTTKKENNLFYGDLILESDVEILGPLNQPRFFIQAKTQSGTQFYVIPLSDEQAIAQDDFIVFGVPALDSLGRDTSFVNNSIRNDSGMDLKLNLEMTSDASLEIIIDPLTGDKLFCKGVSNLAVDMDPEGNVSVVGNYQITEGKYSFSYEQLIKREFTILPNSRISFNGDPLQAQLDITAAYQLRVPLTDLVQDQLEEDISLAGQRADVQLQMKISGNLVQPVLSFDIILLGNPQGTVADAARTRLEQLRNNETDLNTQVFGLLLFNSFITPSNGSFSVTTAGETALLSSLSKLVTNELNRLASGLLKGVDFRLGIEAYKPGLDATGDDGITTEVQLGVSKRLWNDRLNVTVGGNINVGNTGQEQQALTALTGDFALEYQLTPDGDYLLRVYQRSDYDALYEGNVNKGGAGISIRKTLPNKERNRQE